MYSLFDLDIRAVIRESVDYIIETLDVCTDNEQLDSDNESTLDFIKVKVPALPESGDYSTEEHQKP
jgi:hypothetical protein